MTKLNIDIVNIIGEYVFDTIKKIVCQHEYEYLSCIKNITICTSSELCIDCYFYKKYYHVCEICKKYRQKCIKCNLPAKVFTFNNYMITGKMCYIHAFYYVPSGDRPNCSESLYCRTFCFHGTKYAHKSKCYNCEKKGCTSCVQTNFYVDVIGCNGYWLYRTKKLCSECNNRKTYARHKTFCDKNCSHH